ncbi:hypothetical protein PVAP13_5NG256481 [Panicum virgatum]|uniref:Uncharacterized protein n=1 Tax=Panicum virgatum TaxID=38727 RepID=A0A8T0RRQ8_PANVG|nr:hypothetical protein PVAP13_5NG256481 [Panicum virgatum]
MHTAISPQQIARSAALGMECIHDPPSALSTKRLHHRRRLPLPLPGNWSRHSWKSRRGRRGTPACRASTLSGFTNRTRGSKSLLPSPPGSPSLPRDHINDDGARAKLVPSPILLSIYLLFSISEIVEFLI